MSDDSRELSRMEDILSGEDYLPKKPMSRVEELLLDGAMVPKVDSTDNGKVLKVIDGEWKPGEDVSGDNLPPVSSLDNGKVLKVVSGEWNIGDDKSDSVVIQLSSAYPFSSSTVALPENIKIILMANYSSTPKVPTYLMSSNGYMFEPYDINVSVGNPTTVVAHWRRIFYEFDSVHSEKKIYQDYLTYNTLNDNFNATYSKTLAIDPLPAVEEADVGKVLKATDVGEYDWSDDTDNKVTQTDTNNGVYDILLSGSAAGSGTATEGAKKSGDYPFKYSTHGNILMVGDSNSTSGGVDIGVAGVPGVTIGKTSLNDGAKKYLNVKMDDIQFHAAAGATPDTWDGTNTSLKNAIAAASSSGGVAVPPVIFDDGGLKKMEILGFPGIEKVYLNPTAYSNLTTAQKEDLSKIYYVSDYEFHADPDHPEVVVRIGSNNETKWFFSGYTFANNARYEVPESLRQYQPNNGHGSVRVDSLAYATATSTEPINPTYFVGWSNMDQNNKMRYYSITGTSASILNGTVYAVIDIAGGSAQSNAYSDPYDVPSGFTIYYGGKQYTDFDIPDPLPSVTSSDNGKVLKVVSGAWAADTIPTGLEVVKLSQTAYDSLSDAQKKNGKMYLIDASIFTGGIPRVSGADSKITASSQNGSGSTYSAWLAFDGVDHTPGTDNDGWVPSNGNDQWIKYQFTSATPINKILFKAVSRNVNNWSGTIYIEGSNDDTTWENILKNKLSITTELPDRSSSSVEFNEEANGKSYTYIRLRIDNQAYQRFMLAEFDADITTLTYDSIYYMDRQYSTMYEPVPEVTMADEGKALIVNSEGEWDKASLPASIAPVRLSKSAYDALTPAQKTDTSKLYLIDGSIITDETLISPDDLSADDGKVIGTGGEGNRPAWKAFDGIKPTSGFDNCFYPAYNSDPCYVGYHFTDKAHKITKVCYRVHWLGNAGTITNSVYVEGSNDGTNWTDIGGGAVAMSIEESSYSDYEVPCDMNEWSYVRMRFGSAVNVTGSNKFFAVSEMEIYATETAKVYNAICYNNAEYASLDPIHYYREISQYNYDQLPDTKNSDGIIYFITDNS